MFFPLDVKSFVPTRKVGCGFVIIIIIMLRSRVAALRSQEVGGGVTSQRGAVVARGQSGRKRVRLVKTMQSYPMKPKQKNTQNDRKKKLTPQAQDYLLNAGVPPSDLFDVLQGNEPGEGDLFGKRKRESTTTRKTTKSKKREEEDEDDEDNSLLNSPLFYAYAHMETEDGEVLYGKWSCDGGCSCVDKPVVLGPEFDIYLTAQAARNTYANTTKPLLYVSKDESLLIRPRDLTLDLLFGLLSYSGVIKTDIYRVMDALITILMKDERCRDGLTELSRLVKKQKPEPEHELWCWPPSPLVFMIPREAVEEACKSAAAELGIGEEYNAWSRMLGTVRGRRYFFYKEIQQVEYYFRGCGLLEKTQRSMAEGLLRLRPQSLVNLVKVLTQGDPFRLCFYNLSPVNAILPELPSVSYRYMFAKDQKRIPIPRLTAVAIYQEALKRDANPLLPPCIITKEGLAKLSEADKPLVKPVYYVHSQDKREGAATEDDSGHCFTHLSTLMRLFPNPQYNVLEGVKLLANHKIIALAPALCSGDNRSAERHVYLRALYQQTLDLVAALVEIERRALVLRPKPPQKPDQCIRYRNSPMCKIPHSEDQCASIADAAAVGSPGIILTGCAGTGKTATCAKIAAHYPSESIISFAPTGKASDLLDRRVAPSDTGHHYYYKHKRARMGDSSSSDSETPKSLYQGKELVIADEGSLMPLWLLSKLLRDIVQNSQVHRFLICGDPDQLPSVEAGCVLSDLVQAYSQLDSEYSEWTKRLHQLSICHRAESLEIYENAMAIKAMQLKQIRSTENFVILESQGSVKEDAEMLFDFMEEKIGVDNMRIQFHVLCSQNRFVDIVNEIAYTRYWKPLDDVEDRNSDLRHNRGSVFQSGSSGGGDGGKKRSRPKRFRIGARIFFKKNIRDFKIKNGQILTILGFRDEDKTTGQVVQLPDGALPLQHQYDRDDLIRRSNSQFRRIAICRPHDGGADAILEIPLDKVSLNSSLCSLAYCSTVHKVQGTEFDYCGAILAKKEPRMVTSTWFYTGETRARKMFVVATAEDTLREVVSRPRLKRLSDVSILLVKAIRQLRTTIQLGLPVEATTEETVWWSNKAGMKPFTAYPHWNQNVPVNREPTTSTTASSSSSSTSMEEITSSECV